MSWAARRTDDDRLLAIRWLHLRGVRDRLEHKIGLLRLDLAHELRMHCRDGSRTPEALRLEGQLQTSLAELSSIFAEIREVRPPS
jgi:hypothetical protein